MEKSKKNMHYIYIGAAISLFLLAVVFIITARRGEEGQVGMGRSRIRASAVAEKAQEPLYDISKLKQKEVVVPSEEIRDLSAVYKNYPKEDVGDNVIEGWAKVPAEDKVRFMEGLDKQIAVAQESLKTDPSDKRARSLLAVSESLKKLASQGFDYRREEKTTQESH